MESDYFPADCQVIDMAYFFLPDEIEQMIFVHVRAACRSARRTNITPAWGI